MSILRKINDLRNTDRNNIQLIKKSDYFDEDYYLNENPNIKISPVKHYYYYGFKEGKSPSYKFSNDFYLNEHKDVQASGMNPLVHYLRYGKMENRKIQKDNGTSVQGLYYKFFNYNYSLNIYLTDEKINRVNLFFDNINEEINKYKEIIDFVINYCITYHYKLRIIYSNSDLDYLNSFFCDNKIKIPKNIEYLYLKESNYLFVGENDKYICTSYKCVNALLNCKIINTCIYFYIINSGYTLEEKYYISKMIQNPNVICLSSKKIMIDKYSIEFEVKNTIKNEKFYYIANDLFLEGIIWINKMLNENIINNYKFNVLYNKKLNFHFDSDVDVKCESEIFKLDNNEVFKIASGNKDNINIIGLLKNEKSNIKIYDLSNYDIIKKEHIFIEYFDENYLKFVEMFKKNGE